MDSRGEMSLPSTYLLSAPHRCSEHHQVQDPERLLVLAGVTVSPAQPLAAACPQRCCTESLLCTQAHVSGLPAPIQAGGEAVLGDDPSSTPAFLHFYSLQHPLSLLLHRKTQSN